MDTYDVKQILSDYGSERLDVEQAMDHSLQHLSLLYEGQQAATADRRELRQNVTALETDVKSLQAGVKRLQKRQPEIDRLQKLEESLAALSLTLANLKADVDSLNHRLSNAGAGDPSAKN